MIPVAFEKEKRREIVCVNGKPYVFTNLRVERDTIPKDMRAYDVRDGGGDGVFRQVKPFVLVNHWATIIGYDRINDAEGEGYSCAEPDGLFLDFYVTEDEYRQQYSEMEKVCSGLVEETEGRRKALDDMSDADLLKAFFGVFSEYTDEAEFYSGDVISAVEDSLEMEALKKRLDTKDREDALEAYICAADDYLSERDCLLEGDEDADEEEVKNLLAKVRDAERDLSKTLADRATVKEEKA